MSYNMYNKLTYMRLLTTTTLANISTAYVNNIDNKQTHKHTHRVTYSASYIASECAVQTTEPIPSSVPPNYLFIPVFC